MNSTKKCNGTMNNSKNKLKISKNKINNKNKMSFSFNTKCNLSAVSTILTFGKNFVRPLYIFTYFFTHTYFQKIQITLLE